MVLITRFDCLFINCHELYIIYINHNHVLSCMSCHVFINHQSMEKSFEDLLHGLDSDSEPDLDEMITNHSTISQVTL